MKNYLLSILTGLLFNSCGLTSNYQNPQHSVYSKILTPDEKTTINQSGEITKDIEIKDQPDNRILKGTLRILKTERQDVFNFVEIGQWIDIPNSDVKDSITYDNLGNTTLSLVYYKHESPSYTLVEKWTSEIKDGLFIQRVQNFKDGILRSEYERETVDFKKPKSDLQKQKILRTRKDYSADGQLLSTKTFDKSGKLMKD